MARALLSLWPELNFLSMETGRCILSRSPNGYPAVIDKLSNGIFDAAGGNGGSAKSSDALGQLAATLAQKEPWPQEIPRDLFRAQYA